MTRITNNQELIMLVRQQLGKVSRAKTSRAAKVRNNKTPKQSADVSSVQQLQGLGDFSEEELARAVVQSFLTEEFGDGLINDAQFQQIVDRISHLISEDADANMLMKESLKKLDAGKEKNSE